MIKQFELKSQEIFDGLETELLKIRSGRAHPGILDSLKVIDQFGTTNHLKQLASVNVQDARTLVITPWDQKNTQLIAKAIQESDLGLNPNLTGDKIIVQMPALTEERRREINKLVKQEGEKTKISLRHHRRDLLTAAKNQVKQKSMTEDEEKRLLIEVDKLIDRYNKNIDQRITSKEKEILSL